MISRTCDRLAVARVADDRFERTGIEPRRDSAAAPTARGAATSARMRAIESPLGRKGRASSPASFATARRRRCGQPAHRARSAASRGAEQREAQPVAGDRIDEAGRVTRQQHSRHPARPHRPPAVRAPAARRRCARARNAARDQSLVARRSVNISDGSASARAGSWSATTRHALASPPGTGATPM